jgi:hypothetical protein
MPLWQELELRKKNQKKRKTGKTQLTHTAMLAIVVYGVHVCKVHIYNMKNELRLRNRRGRETLLKLSHGGRELKKTH